MIELLKKRMMTLVATVTGAVAYAEAQGVELLAALGGIIDQGVNTGTALYAAVVVGLAAFQNHLNKSG